MAGILTFAPSRIAMFPVAFHASFCHPVPEGHRFPMAKYELLPQQLLREGIVQEEDFFEPTPVGRSDVYAVHDPDYINRFVGGKLTAAEARRTGFAQSALLVERELRLANGTLLGAVKAMDRGIAFNIAGGTHHAGRDFGEGFCMINDQAVAAQHLISQQGLKKVLIIDLDVHQGNGTAHIFSNEPKVFTFSMHGKNNFPFRKEKSDLDIGLEDGTDDNTYLKLLKATLPGLIDRVIPDFIFYQSGVDILATDRMGRMHCSLEGCRLRDEIVLALAAKRGIPLQCSMGGGYAPDIKTILQAHTNTYRVAQGIY